MTDTTRNTTSLLHPPVVTILGHVDHGKTSLLDYIRKTNIAGKEYGGITQHIGAYQIEYKHKKITFIDTPGHEAFAKMRSRGAEVADVAVLVVAGNDGVMPQTIESLEYINASKIPCVVAITKTDLPDINFDKIKKQLTKNGLKLEEYGGDIPVVPVSIKTNQGIDKLLEMILLLSELKENTETDTNMLKATVIESTMTKNKGITATAIIRTGKLTVGDNVICENQTFKIRAILDWKGNNLINASIGDPVEILGWQSVPAIGSTINVKSDLYIDAKKLNPIISFQKTNTLNISPQILPPEEEKIHIIIKADTYGTLEAILEILKKKESINFISSGVGTISESDIFLAKTTKSIVIGFQIKPTDSVIKLAESEKVNIKIYNIIYDLLSDIDEVVEAIRTGNLVKILGTSKIAALFTYNDQTIAGVKVISGRIARGDQVKIMRGDVEITRAKIKSLRHGKDDITVANQGTEAGILLSHKVDLLTGDSIISIG